MSYQCIPKLILTLLCTLLLFSSSKSHRVVESVEDTAYNANSTTTLYPTNSTEITKAKIKSEASWKIETAFTDEKKDNQDVKESKDRKDNKENKDSNSTDSSEHRVVEKPENSGEFKPSPHLGSFFDEEVLKPTTPTFGFTPLKKPPTGFLSSQKERHKLVKFPKDVFRQNEFPYKFESGILTKAKNNWKPLQDSKPTDEVPQKVPAGGLYQLPDPFKEKPSLVDGGDDDFALDFTDGKGAGLSKKRPDPWKKILHLLTAFIPVGLIISALTPNVITISNAQDTPLPPQQFFHRRSDSSPLPVISERCRRRLLCELHSEINYHPPPLPHRRGKNCYRILCDDPDSLQAALDWLLTYQPAGGRRQLL